MIGLTQRQGDILRFIQSEIVTKGYPPTLRELGKHFSIRSTNGVVEHLASLERKGYLTREDVKSRGIRLTGKLASEENPQDRPLTATGSSDTDVIVYSRIVSGPQPFLAVNVVNTFRVGRATLGGGHAFGLRMASDVMGGVGIVTGDVVLFENRGGFEHDVVGCVLVGDEAIVRHIYIGADHVKLVAARKDTPPILVRRSDFDPRMMLGVAVGMVRGYASLSG